nr:ribonuclease H-like domain-containing protein [Tanacetum cinerariifolium]
MSAIILVGLGELIVILGEIKRLHGDIRVTIAQVIVNGDSVSSVASASVEGPIPPKTAKQKLARKDELKAKSNLMLSIPNEHLLKFHACKDAKSLWEAIKNSQEGLDKTYDRFQKLISQLEIHDNEDLEQIDIDDLEEMDLKWHVAMLTMRVKRRGHFARECRAPRNQGNRNRDAPTRNALVDTYTTNALVVQDEIGGYDWSFQAEKELTNFALMEYTSQGSSSSLNSDSEKILQVKDISIKDLKNQLENDLKEKDNLKLKLEKFETSSKNLSKLINSQLSAIDKTGLSYDGQMNESDLNDIYMNESEVLNMSASRESDRDDNQVHDRFKKGERYHAVPPPYTRNYMPLRADLSFVRLDNSVFKSKVSETITSVPKIETNASKTSKDSLEKPKTIRNRTVENKNKTEKPRKHSQSPRGNKRNLNGLMTQKLGDGFEFKKKACFVCGSINHLIKDCDFYENKMVLNNKGKIIGSKEIRPVWDNTTTVNHQNKLTHPHLKRNFVPTAILTKSGQVPVNVAKQSSHRAAASVSAVRLVNTSIPIPTTYSYFKAHSPVRRPFNQKSAAKSNNFNKKVNTAKVNHVTTDGPKVVVSAVEGNRNNLVKSSAC